MDTLAISFTRDTIWPSGRSMSHPHERTGRIALHSSTSSEWTKTTIYVLFKVLRLFGASIISTRDCLELTKKANSRGGVNQRRWEELSIKAWKLIWEKVSLWYLSFLLLFSSHLQRYRYPIRVFQWIMKWT